MPWFEEIPKEEFFAPSPRCNSGIVVALSPKDFENPDGEKIPVIIIFGGDANGVASDEAFRYSLGWLMFLYPFLMPPYVFCVASFDLTFYNNLTDERRWQRIPFQPVRRMDGDQVKQPDNKDRPPAISRHTMNLRKDNRSVVIYGGVGREPRAYSDLYQFDAGQFC
jgi:hypothetical protein